MNGKSSNIKVAAVIPALNESLTIGLLISVVSKYATPIVVDDGSTDSTAAVAKDHGAHVVSHETNKGYEAALVTGFNIATQLGMHYVITLDADGQHDPHLIQCFINELFNGADIVVGERDKFQRIGEYIFSVIGALLWGIQDPLCGMKAYNINCVQPSHFLQNYDSIGSKYAITGSRTGKKIKNMKIITKSRKGRSRFGSGWSANKKILIALYHSLKKYSG